MDPEDPCAAPPWTAPFLVRGTRVLAIGGIISVLVALTSSVSIVSSLAYGLPTTLGCWLFIDGGRLFVAGRLPRTRPDANPHWPGWGWMLAVIIVGTVLGFALGQVVGNLLTGRPATALPKGGLNLLAILLMSMVPGLLATQFFYSRVRLAMSEAQAQQAQRQATEARLRLLESQLEPHMLFNTLANLRALIVLDPEQAQAMLDQLISFLRSTLNASRTNRHALSAEFARLADYLSLMQVRMGKRLQTRLDLPEDLADAAVPPLLLQPLVENAIRHGLEPSVPGGRIEVEAMRDGNMLELRVRDTGVGLAAPAREGTRFGLQQVRERLATQYGDSASLTLAPAESTEGGTLAVVRLPLEP